MLVVRSAVMPINNKYPIEEVLDACREYTTLTRRRVSFEWALINGVNDTEEAAQELGTLLHGMLCHVNLIPLNPTAGYDGEPSDKERVARFVETLARYGIKGTVRGKRGLDIEAGCGQLAQSRQPTRRTNTPLVS